jgi:hypothetical protein
MPGSERHTLSISHAARASAVHAKNAQRDFSFHAADWRALDAPPRGRAPSLARIVRCQPLYVSLKGIILLREAKAFKHFKLRARDGDIGKAEEFYFDDKYWVVRYLVADTGSWLSDRQVLISPYALGQADDAERVLPVRLTKKQIEDSPPLISHQPVSRQYELDYYAYYQWPYYGYGPYSWGFNPYLVRDGALEGIINREQNWDPHLRSTRDATGHHIQAQDGELGHVADFIIDDESWAIRYLVVDTKNWWPGKHVLVAPGWIERISWEDGKVFVNLSREDMKRSPAYPPSAHALDRDYEVTLYRHYNRNGYWTDELTTREEWAARSKHEERKGA